MATKSLIKDVAENRYPVNDCYLYKVAVIFGDFNGIPAHINSLAYESKSVIVINRVKPHSSFHLNQLQVSEALVEEVSGSPLCKITGSPELLKFGHEEI